jgi:hypothetical protein
MFSLTQETRGTACSTLQMFNLADCNFRYYEGLKTRSTELSFAQCLAYAVGHWDNMPGYLKFHKYAFVLFSILRDEDGYAKVRTGLEELGAAKTDVVYNEKNMTDVQLYILSVPQILKAIEGVELPETLKPQKRT